MHDNGDELFAVALSRCTEAAAGRARPAGLDAGAAFVSVEQLIRIDTVRRMALRRDVVDILGLRADDAAEGIVVHGIGGNLGHIACRRVMVGIRHAVHVDEMRMRRADFLRFCVHHRGERGLIPTDCLSDGRSGTVVGDHHHLLQDVGHAQRVAWIEARALDVGGIRANGDELVRAALLEREDAGHHLRHAGRILALIRIFLVEHLPRRLVDDDGGICRDVRCGSHGHSRPDEQQREAQQAHIDFLARFQHR